MKKKWIEKQDEHDIETKAKHIQEKFKLSKLTSKLIARKKLENDKEIEIFLNPTRHDFRNPFEMPDMEKAVDRIIIAINNNEKIIIYGDYDVDGITSSSILKRFFKDRGIEVDVYIPNRLDEGYGLNEQAIKKIANEGYNLIITVDCGITAIKETKLAQELGMDVIITDHHEPGEEIPKTVAVVDCKRKTNKYPFRELAGCGVAFKLVQALSIKLELDETEYLKYLDLACIGTISDIVPLVDENRTIAKLGLLLVKQTKNTGLRELIKIIGSKEINARMISFGISPRINACGRMGHENDALELLLTDDPIKARKLAQNLEDYNKQRQSIEKRIFEEAIEEINKKEDKKSCIVLAKKNWHHGVIGIVSSKITEIYYKPSILVCIEGEDAKGSGRSIPGFDLHEAICNCSKNLTNYGGHSMAIGLSLKTAQFEAFKKEMEEYAEKNINEEMLEAELKIDEEINGKDININSIKELNLLEPFGESNSEPIIIYKNLRIIAIRTLSDGKHLKLSLQDDNTYIEAIGFNLGNLVEQYIIGDKVDVVGNIQLNSYNNIDKVQIVLRDIRKTLSI